MRHIIVTIPVADLLNLVTGKRTVANLPQDAHIVSIWIDGFELAGEPPAKKLIRLRIESEELPEVEMGKKLPKLQLQLPGIERSTVQPA